MSMVLLPGFIPDIRDSPVQFKVLQRRILSCQLRINKLTQSVANI